MAYLINIRHGQSEWNLLGQWTGWNDIPLTPKGRGEAEKTALQLKDIPINVAYTSNLVRAKETMEIILETLGISIPITANQALNERNYGIFTGKNKWQVKEEIGDVEFQKLRRSWNYPIPEGETLEDVYNRVVPYYENFILADLKAGKNIAIAAHGNSLRALAMHLEGLTTEQVISLEIGTAEAHIYLMDENGRFVSKEIRSENEEKSTT